MTATLSIQERLEQLAEKLRQEQDRNTALEQELSKARAKPEELVVLSASKDLWRGTDERREQRPDNVGAGEAVARTPTTDPSAPSVPSADDAMQAAVARALRGQGAAAAAQ